MSPQTTRLLQLGAAAFRTERIDFARTQLVEARDAQRRLTHAITAGESVDAPARQLDQANDAFKTAMQLLNTWNNTTIDELVAAAVTNIRATV